MAKAQNDKRQVSLEIQADIVDRSADMPAVAAYAFSQGGALLASQPIDQKGHATLAVPVGAEGQTLRVVVGPMGDEKAASVGELLRRGAVERHVAVRPGSERLPGIAVTIHPDIWRCWLRTCVVKGTLLKRVVSGGVTIHLPVCDATVDIYEVDPWFVILPRLPDVEIDRLRDIVDGPWPPFDIPIPPPPPPEFVPDILPDFSPVLLNPQPLPPKAFARRLNRGALVGFDPQPEPPVPALPLELRLVARAPRQALERAVLGNLELFRPVLCWLYPRFVTKTKVATVTTDDCGHFRTTIWHSCVDKPDLYFVARQRFWPGFWITIYEKLPVGCHTYWNYACGTEVTLITTNPLARACAPCPPIIAPNNWVLFMAIGNTSVWRIHGANTATRVGSAGHDPAKRGLVDDTTPWGGTLRPRLEFDNSLRDSLGVRYYRVSVKRPSEPDSEWRPSTEAVNRHYTHEVGDDLVLEQYPLGPHTVGTSPHLYEIPPALPPTGQWSLPNVVLDTQSAVFHTNAVAPGTPFDDNGAPVGDDQGGLWQIKVELFDAGGTQVDPEALDIAWRVPESASLTGTIETANAATLGLVNAAQNCMIVTVRIDNNRCAASIQAPTLSGNPAADQCGVMNYTAKSETVTMPFRALQRNRFATYDFFVQRGAVTPPELSIDDATAAASAATMPAAPSETVANLLDDCNIAGFTEQLYVRHMAIDGWSRQSQYDASAVRAFVLSPNTP